jgi:serine/threonine protein kinase
MGVVYEAFDRELGTTVALKTLRHLGPERLLRFKNEFRALHDIQHRNLVGLGELCEDEGRWFFTMELVPGVPFLSYVRRDAAAPESTFTTEDLGRALPRDLGPAVSAGAETFPLPADGAAGPAPVRVLVPADR